MKRLIMKRLFCGLFIVIATSCGKSSSKGEIKQIVDQHSLEKNIDSNFSYYTGKDKLNIKFRYFKNSKGKDKTLPKLIHLNADKKKSEDLTDKELIFTSPESLSQEFKMQVKCKTANCSDWSGKLTRESKGKSQFTLISRATYSSSYSKLFYDNYKNPSRFYSFLDPGSHYFSKDKQYTQTGTTLAVIKTRFHNISEFKIGFTDNEFDKLEIEMVKRSSSNLLSITVGHEYQNGRIRLAESSNKNHNYKSFQFKDSFLSIGDIKANNIYSDFKEKGKIGIEVEF